MDKIFSEHREQVGYVENRRGNIGSNGRISASSTLLDPVYGGHNPQGAMPKQGAVAPSVLPIDMNIVPIDANRTFYDLSSRTISKLTNLIPKNGGGYMVSSPFLSQSTLAEINSSMHDYNASIQHTLAKIEHLKKNKTTLSQQDYTNHVLGLRTRYKAYVESDLVERIKSLESGISLANARIIHANAGIDGINSELPFNKISQEQADAKINAHREHIQRQETIIRTNSSKLQTLIEEREKYSRMYKNMESYIENKVPLTDESIGAIDADLAKRRKREIAVLERELDVELGARPYVEKIIDNMRQDIEFNTFGTQGELASAYAEVSNIDVQTRKLTDAFYEKGIDSNGQAVYMKKDFMPLQTVSLNPLVDNPDERMTFKGIEDIDGRVFDHSASNIADMLEPVDSDGAFSSLNKNSGAISYDEAKDVKSLVQNYLDTQNGLAIEEQTVLHNKVKKEISLKEVQEQTATAASEKASRLQGARERMLNAKNKRKPNAVIDSYGNQLSESVRDKVKLRRATSASKNPMAYVKDAEAGFDIDMLKELAGRKGLDPSVSQGISKFIGSLSGLNDAERLIGEGSYNVLTSAGSPFEGMPYSTKEEVDALVLAVRESKVKDARKSAEDLQYAISDIDFSSHWNRLEATKEALSISREDEIIEKGYLNGGLDRSQSEDPLDAMHKQNRKAMSEVERQDMQLQVREALLTEDAMGNVVKVRQRDTEALNIGLTKGTDKIGLRSIGQDIKDGTLTQQHLSQGYVVTDKGNKVTLQAYDEFNDLISMSKLRGPVDTFGQQTVFSPAEWANGKVAFGGNQYDIRKFAEYYEPDIREVQNNQLVKMPNSKELQVRSMIQDNLQQELDQFVSTATERVEYPSRIKTTRVKDGKIVPSTETREVLDNMATNVTRSLEYITSVMEKYPNSNEYTGNVRTNITSEQSALAAKERIAQYADKQYGWVFDSLDKKSQSIIQESISLLDAISNGQSIQVPSTLLGHVQSNGPAVAFSPNFESMKKTRRVSKHVNVPAFRNESYPENINKRTKGGLLSIERSTPNVTIDNYKEVFNSYGIDPSSTSVGRAIEEYNIAKRSGITISNGLNSEDLSYLENIMEYRRLNELEKNGGPRRSIVVDREVDMKVQSKFDNTTNGSSRFQMKGDILSYKTIDQKGKYATVEADHVLFSDMTLDIEYSGNKSLAELIENTANLYDSLGSENIKTDNLSIWNKSDIIIGGNEGTSARTMTREDIFNRVMGNTRQLSIESVDKYDNVKSNKHNLPKVALDVMESNWAWMREDERAVGISYEAVSEAINELTSLDIQEAAEALNVGRRKNGLDLIDLSDPMKVGDQLLNETIEKAVHQRTKGKLIKSYFDESTSQGMEPAIRVVLKMLDAKGEQHDVSNVKSHLRLVREEFGKAPYSSYYKYVDEIMNNDSYIAEQIRVNGEGVQSVESMSRQTDKFLEQLDSFEDYTRDIANIDFDERSAAKAYARQHGKYTDVGAGGKAMDDAMSNFELFTKEIRESVEKDILMSEKNLSVDNSLEMFLNNYSSYDFSNRWVSKSVPKKRKKELRGINDWRELQRKHGVEWLSARDAVGENPGKLAFKNAKEAQAILEGTYTDIVNSTKFSKEIKESLLTNREANVKKALEMSKVQTQKGKTIYKASKGYMNVRQSIIDSVAPSFSNQIGIQPGFVNKAGTKGMALFSDKDRVAQALVSVHTKHNRGVAGVADVLSMVGDGTILGGLQTLFGSDPNSILKGMLTTNPNGTQGHRGLSINSKEGMQFFQMMGNLMGDIRLTGRAQASDGRYIGFTLNNYLDNNGIVGGIVTSLDGKAYRAVHDRSEAVTRISKNLIDADEIYYAKSSPTSNQISGPLTERIGDEIVYNLTPSSTLDYDFVQGRYGQNIADPTTSAYNAKKALGSQNSKVVIFDFETTGLMGEIDDKLFAPVELGYIETYTKNGEIVPGKAHSVYARPTNEIKEKILGTTGAYGEDKGYTNMINGLVDKVGTGDSEFELFKNYAKYDELSGSTYGGKIQLVDEIIDGKVAGKAIKLQDGSVMSKEDYVLDMVESAQNVVSFMTGETDVNTTKVKGEILPMKDFVDFTSNMLERNDYIMGHNTNSADLRWLGKWKRMVGDVDNTDSLALKNIDTLEMMKMAYPGRSNYKLENVIADIMGNADAHLAGVDVEGTRRIANMASRSDEMIGIFGDLSNPMRSGDVFVKTAMGSQGIEGLPKGLFRFKGIEGVNEPMTRQIVTSVNGKDIIEDVLDSYTRQVTVLEDMLTGKTLKVPFQNSASLKREAIHNWKSFGADEVGARAYHNVKQASDVNRTMSRSFNYSRWTNYTAKGKELQGDTNKVLSGLRGILDNGLLDQRTMQLTENVYRNGDLQDIELLALSNVGKLSDVGLVKELSAGKFRDSRLDEYKAFAQYADSNEGQLVKQYLYEGDLRKRAYNRADKSQYIKDYETELRDIVKDVRGTTPGLEDYKIDIPNKRTVATVTPDTVNRHNGGKYNIDIDEAFNIDVDFTNRASVERSLWNSVTDISDMLVAGGSVKRADSKNVAINEFIMPILGESLNGTSVMDEELVAAITKNKAQANAKIGSEVADLNNNLARTMSVLTSRLTMASNNNEQFIENLATVREVDMHRVIPQTHEAYQTVMETIESRFKSALGKLDDNLATVSQVINGEPTEVINNNIKFVQSQVVEMLKSNDQRYKDIVMEQFGVKDVDAVMSHLNLNMTNSEGKAFTKGLQSIGEVHYDKKNPELSYKSASEIASEIKSLASDIKIPNIGELNGLLHELSQIKSTKVSAQSIYDKDPDFFNYLREVFSGFYTDESNIKQMNEQVKTAVENYANKFDKAGMKQLKKRKNDLYQALGRRAMLTDHVNGNVIGEVTDEIYNSHLTKYRAMEELGLIQMHDGKRYTGKIGLPGKFKPGVELDPSKVIVATSPGIDYNGIGNFAGYSLTDLTEQQLKDLKDSRYGTRDYNPILSSYYERLDKAFNESKLGYYEAKNAYNIQATASYVKKQEEFGEKQLKQILDTFQDTPTEPSKVQAINQNIKERTQDIVESAIPTTHTPTKPKIEAEIPWSLTDTEWYQTHIGGFNKKKSEAFAKVKQIMNSKAVRYSAVAASAATALALTYQYTSSGRTEEQTPNGGAPSVDGNYQTEYNGVDRKYISVPKSVRLEENGKGLNIRGRAKNSNYVTDGAIDDAIRSSINDSFETNVNITYQDDRDSINQEYVQGLFSSALR